MNKLSIDEFADELLRLLPRLTREILSYQSSYITTGKITYQQLIFLEYLYRVDKCQMQRLVDDLRTSFSNATEMLDRLVRQGLVNRERSESDRRVVYVSISVGGKKIIRDIYSKKRKGIVKIFNHITADQRARYLEIIEQLVTNLSEEK